VYTRAARNARARTLVGAACYTEVLYRLTVGNRREAEESLSGAAAWLWLSYIINLSLSASLPLPRVFVLSVSPCSLSLAYPLWWLPSALPSRFSSTSPPASSVCRCCSARPAIYASVESVRCCGQLPRFKENQELRPERDPTSARSPGPSPGTFRSLTGTSGCIALRTLYHSGTIHELPFSGCM